MSGCCYRWTEVEREDRCYLHSSDYKKTHQWDPSHQWWNQGAFTDPLLLATRTCSGTSAFKLQKSLMTLRASGRRESGRRNKMRSCFYRLVCLSFVNLISIWVFIPALFEDPEASLPLADWPLWPVFSLLLTVTPERGSLDETWVGAGFSHFGPLFTPNRNLIAGLASCLLHTNWRAAGLSRAWPPAEQTRSGGMPDKSPLKWLFSPWFYLLEDVEREEDVIFTWKRRDQQTWTDGQQHFFKQRK